MLLFDPDDDGYKFEYLTKKSLLFIDLLTKLLLLLSTDEIACGILLDLSFFLWDFGVTLCNDCDFLLLGFEFLVN